MRARLNDPTVIVVRPLKAMTADELGDVSPVPSRLPAFNLLAQIDLNRDVLGSLGDPGLDVNLTATALIRRSDVPPSAPDGWEPAQNDLVIFEGRSLFVAESVPAFHKKARFGAPSGYGGWKVYLTSEEPRQRGANRYE